MKQKTQAVFNGYLNLSYKQKRKLLRKIRKRSKDIRNSYLNLPPEQEYRFFETLSEQLQKAFPTNDTTKVALGPIRGGCPCCGK